MFYSLVTLLAAGQALAVPLSSATTLKSRLAAPAAYVTTSDLSHKLSPAAAPVSGTGTGGSSTWDLKVDDTAAGHKQTIIGFGGSVTDATVTVLNALPANKRDQLLRQLLTADGADFSFLRHTIASSDLSGPPAYTYDDAGGKADPSLTSFNLGDRGTAMAKMLAAMRGIKAGLTILGSPWSAPGWMKLNRV
ncbi:glycoside hydrolase, partial [Xylaria arbuscula]